MDFLGAIAFVLGFASLIYLFGLVPKSKQAISISRQALQTIGDDDLSDVQKEKLLQSSSLRLFMLMGQLTVGCICAVLIPLGVVWVAELGGLMSLDAVISFLLRIDFMLGTTVVGIAVYFLVVKWSQKNL